MCQHTGQLVLNLKMLSSIKSILYLCSEGSGCKNSSHALLCHWRFCLCIHCSFCSNLAHSCLHWRQGSIVQRGSETCSMSAQKFSKENGLGYQSPNFQPQTISLWTCILQYMEYKLAFRHLHTFSVYMVLKVLESLKQPHYRCMGTNTQNQNRIKSKLLWHSINMPSYY